MGTAVTAGAVRYRLERVQAPRYASKNGRQGRGRLPRTSWSLVAGGSVAVVQHAASANTSAFVTSWIQAVWEPAHLSGMGYGGVWLGQRVEPSTQL
jgi:hypothetical protein